MICSHIFCLFIRTYVISSLQWIEFLFAGSVSDRGMFYDYYIVLLRMLLDTKGDVVDVHGSVLREVPFGADGDGPVFTGRLQVIGPGFAPFKPYLRPHYFYFRVSLTCDSIII